MSANHHPSPLTRNEPTPEQWEAIRRAQVIIRRYIPDDVSLVDELIAERRAAAARE